MPNTPDFSRAGLPTTVALALKLWQAAKIQGHKNPFGKPLPEYTVAELDFVLEMEARDNPKEFVFVRDGESSDGSHVTEAKAAWVGVLRGKSLAKRLSGIPFSKVAAYHARRVGGARGMTPGVRERGKDGK